MNNLLTVVNEEMTISHRVVAEQTANQEVSIRNILNKFISDFEEFGRLHFKNEVEKKNNQGGLKPITYFLNEQQAYLLLTYLRNSEIVRNFKVALVKAFFEMRQELYHIASKSFQGKSVAHTINGLKSGLSHKDRRISMLEDRVQELSSKNESLKIENIKFYEEWKANESFVNKMKNILGVEDIKLQGAEHNAMLEIIYQMMSFQNDLDCIEQLVKSRKQAIDNYIRTFNKHYKRSEEYTKSLNYKSLGALQSKFSF